MISSGIQQKIHYATGSLKKIYQLILNIIPIGQTYQINDLFVSEGELVTVATLTNHQQILWIYSLCLIIFINFYGIFILNKKELN